MLAFDGKVAIVTGAGGGLGRAHALEFARRGASVVVNDIGAALDGAAGGGTPASRVVDEIEALGGIAIANGDSIVTPEGGERLVRAAVDEFGRVDIVVNNAGILRDKAFQNTSADNVEPVLDVHLRGAFHVTRPAWVQMREQGYGRVIVTSSSAGLFGNFGQASYGAAKMGLVGLIKVLAQEGRKYSIHANAIAPMARTRMTEGLSGELGKSLDPELVSPVVAFLAHESCQLTGEILSCGGGRVARIFIGMTRGYLGDQLDAETIAEHLDEIFDDHDYLVLGSSGEEGVMLSEMLAARRGEGR